MRKLLVPVVAVVMAVTAYLFASPPASTYFPPDDSDKVASANRLKVASIVGMPEADAKRFVEKSGLTWRLVHRDGVDFAITMDYRTDRVNVWIEQSIVIKYTIG